jgi:hypothetical protein
LEDRVPGDVAWEKVRGKLHALHLNPERLGQTLDEFGFSETWQTFEKQVTTRKQADHHGINQVLLAKENFIQRIAKEVKLRCGRLKGARIRGNVRHRAQNLSIH